MMAQTIIEQSLFQDRSSHRFLCQLLTLLGSHPRGALITDAGRCRKSEVFIDPTAWIQTWNLHEVPSALEMLDSLRVNTHLVGCFAYELAAALETCLPVRNDYGGPLLEFGAYQNLVRPSSDTPAYQELPYTISDVDVDTNRDTYLRQVRSILDQIRSGNVYQVNFTFRLRFCLQGDPRSLFLGLLRAQPVRNAQIHRNEGRWVISLSPELFFQIRGQEIMVQPMKGTRRRGKTIFEDGVERARLNSSSKDRAENLMIVDLMRNDLGRISEFGTVAVSQLFNVKKLPTLFQMTSTVRSRLRDQVPLAEFLTALFPSGSVTGTPKLSAMQLIHQLEQSPRGIYCGALGRFSPQETYFNVPIRTLILRRLDNGNVTSPQGIYRGELGIGSGIVADSNPEQEWAESKLKSMFFLNPPPNFSIIESLRFENGFSRLSQHLARMAASAEYFGFTFDEESILDALRASTRSLNKGLFKVRLLLSPTGEISAETLPFSPAKEPVKVGIAKKRTNPEDPFLFHKTTHRLLYGEAEQSAREEGLWDLIFLNNREEVTEGAICNIFVYVDGRWFTPQQSSGILKGVMREEMLSQLNAEERILLLDDLLNAEEVLVTNSVQGALKAELLLSPHAKMQRS